MIARFKNKIVVEMSVASATILALILTAGLSFGMLTAVAYLYLHDLPQLIAHFEVQTILQRQEKAEIDRQLHGIIENVATAVDSEQNAEQARRKLKPKAKIIKTKPASTPETDGL